MCAITPVTGKLIQKCKTPESIPWHAIRNLLVSHKFDSPATENKTLQLFTVLSQHSWFSPVQYSSSVQTSQPDHS